MGQGMFSTALTGQGILVSGGTWGVGRSVVIEAVRRGAHVVFCGHAANDTLGAEIMAEARAQAGSGQVTFVPTNLAVESDVERFFDVALEQLPALHAVIHSAEAAVRHDDQPLIELSLADWNATLSTNLREPFWVSRRAVQEFLAIGEGGRIVHIISAGDEAPSASRAASHTALQAFVRSIAKEYGRRGVACNAVAVRNARGKEVYAREQLKPDRLGEQQTFRQSAAIAELVLFLASTDASFVNGEVLCAA
jgi:3-oxoacyl-[acyl-carrier protein] reductase